MSARYRLWSGLSSLLALAGCASSPPDTGVHDGQLLPCGSALNCVSSQSRDADQAVEPIHYESSLADARARLLQIIANSPRTAILRNEGNYIHATYTSATFGFVDDVELYFDAEQSRIDIRSASRTGYYDWGVNRKRANAIREAFLQQ